MATFLLTYAFRCGTCDTAINEILVLAADSRRKLAGTVRRVHLGCRFCGSPTAVHGAAKMSIYEIAQIRDLSRQSGRVRDF